MFRHGLRVEEATNLKWEQIDFVSSNIHVRRVKKENPSTQQLGGDELRLLCRLQHEYPASHFVFQSSRKGPLANDTTVGIVEKAGELAELPFPLHPHILRHSTGHYLANKGIDTHIIQAYLGHRNIQHTVRYTEPVPAKLWNFWDD